MSALGTRNARDKFWAVVCLPAATTDGSLFGIFIGYDFSDLMFWNTHYRKGFVVLEKLHFKRLPVSVVVDDCAGSKTMIRSDHEKNSMILYFLHYGIALIKLIASPFL